LVLLAKPEKNFVEDFPMTVRMAYRQTWELTKRTRILFTFAQKYFVLIAIVLLQ
jgi:hypothetical protein